MKKYSSSFLLILLSFLYSCDNNPTSQPKVQNEPDSNQEQINVMMNFAESSSLICELPNYYKTVMKIHSISIDDFNTLKAAFLIDSTKPNKTISLGQIKALYGSANCYEKYLKFDFVPSNKEDNNDITINTTTTYNKYGSCYSIPLFIGIADSLQLSDTDMFECSKAFKQIDPATLNICVIFKVTKNNIQYAFDIVENPKKK